MQSTQRTVRTILEANRLFIDLQREINAALINTYLGVALWGDDGVTADPLSFKGLASRLDLPNTTVSRNLRYLGMRQRKGVEGLGLVYTYTNPHDARQKIVALTPKGVTLRGQLQAIR